MQFSLAPMEEVTGFVYRNVHARIFGPLDKYITPFLVPVQKRGLKTKEKKEIDPENNRGLPVVPQLLTRDSQAFLTAGRSMRALGYTEVNLNLGCPSGTVVPKGRGSGFLKDPEELSDFFSEVFAGLKALPEEDRFAVSVKTRVGLVSPEEFPALLAVFSSFPLCELICHPRVQKDFYKGPLRLEAFEEALRSYPGRLVYNGDLFTRQDLEKTLERYPGIAGCMLGRGLVARPGLIRGHLTGRRTTKEELYAYVTGLYEGYLACYEGNEPNALGKMKEVWYYLEWSLPERAREIKKVKKAPRGEAYQAAVEQVFSAMTAEDLLGVNL